MLKYLLITRKSKFNDTDRIEVECQVILVNVLMPCDAFKETHTYKLRHIGNLCLNMYIVQCVYQRYIKIKPFVCVFEF